MANVSTFPTLVKACEWLICDNIPAQMDRAAFLQRLIDMPCEPSFPWAEAEAYLASLDEDALEEFCIGEEHNAALSPAADTVLHSLFDAMNMLD